MFLELIATLFAGLAAAGVAMALNKGLGGRLPKWMVPVAAGLAMIAATISSEYSWFERTKNGLPEGLEVARAVESKAIYRPWSYMFPYVDRFMAVDLASLRTNENISGQHMVDLAFFGRWRAVQVLPVVVDCVNHRQAQLGSGATFGDDGSIVDAKWAPLDPEDAVHKIICGG